MVQKRVPAKVVPGTKNWYDGRTVHFSSVILDSSTFDDFLFFGHSSLRKVVCFDAFLSGHGSNFSERDGGSREGKSDRVWKESVWKVWYGDVSHVSWYLLV